MDVRAFRALRVRSDLAKDVASLPYDVMNRNEAKSMAAQQRFSFLHIVRAEIDLPDGVEEGAPEVCQQAAETLRRYEREGIFCLEDEPAFYLYRLTFNGRSQTAILAAFAIDDYLAGRIRRHEMTRAAKEEDRIRHFEACEAQTAPIFLTYRQRDAVRTLLAQAWSVSAAETDFIGPGGVRQELRAVRDPVLGAALQTELRALPRLYIADGHHRMASAARVGLRRRERRMAAAPDARPYASDYVMAAAFPDEELRIYPYHRLVRDLADLAPSDFLLRVRAVASAFEGPCGAAVQPERAGDFGLLLDGTWYRFHLSGSGADARSDASGERCGALLRNLDVSLLQEQILEPILGIHDPRRDPRLDFVGGIRGTAELERRCHEDMRLAFSCCPTSMAELLAIADAEGLMPPKSTWFEPKLLSGLLIYPYRDSVLHPAF